MSCEYCEIERDLLKRSLKDCTLEDFIVKGFRPARFGDRLYRVLGPRGFDWVGKACCKNRALVRVFEYFVKC